MTFFVILLCFLKLLSRLGSCAVACLVLFFSHERPNASVEEGGDCFPFKCPDRIVPCILGTEEAVPIGAWRADHVTEAEDCCNCSIHKGSLVHLLTLPDLLQLPGELISGPLSWCWFTVQIKSVRGSFRGLYLPTWRIAALLVCVTYSKTQTS